MLRNAALSNPSRDQEIAKLRNHRDVATKKIDKLAGSLSAFKAAHERDVEQLLVCSRKRKLMEEELSLLRQDLDNVKRMKVEEEDAMMLQHACTVNELKHEYDLLQKKAQTLREEKLRRTNFERRSSVPYAAPPWNWVNQVSNVRMIMTYRIA